MSKPDHLIPMTSDERRYIAAIKRAFPDAVRFHDPSEGRWSRPDHLSGGPDEYHDGGEFYYENAELPADRFYFETEDEAWLELWNEIRTPPDLDAR